MKLASFIDVNGSLRGPDGIKLLFPMLHHPYPQLFDWVSLIHLKKYLCCFFFHILLLKNRLF
jgi:hypothetical protein